MLVHVFDYLPRDNYLFQTCFTKNIVLEILTGINYSSKEYQQSKLEQTSKDFF